jgi:hypothetical protein
MYIHCYFKLGSGRHSDPKFGRRRGSVSYTDVKKKVPKRRSGLCPSEIEIPERLSGTFHHKIPLYVYQFKVGNTYDLYIYLQ